MTQLRLTSQQQRSLRRYRRLLEMAGLSAAVTLERGTEEPEAITPSLNAMSDQIVRSFVVSEYTLIDECLNEVIRTHFFGRGAALRRARRTKRYHTLELMLQQVYLSQKLTLLQGIREVPRSIVSDIRALNDLRNGVAHTLFLDPLPEAKRTFKGKDVFHPEGFGIFKEATARLLEYFMPFLVKLREAEETGAPPSA